MHLLVKNGGLAERSKAAVLKTVVPSRVPGVRIPKPPPLENNPNKKSSDFLFISIENSHIGIRTKVRRSPQVASKLLPALAKFNPPD